ncbi:hypothetical protein LTR50_005430 [Elasticomyces elasticus]|nr:hypothetical protein LTR50_005430 [Elasticomyces elasticus]
MIFPQATGLRLFPVIFAFRLLTRVTRSLPIVEFGSQARRGLRTNWKADANAEARASARANANASANADTQKFGTWKARPAFPSVHQSISPSVHRSNTRAELAPGHPDSVTAASAALRHPPVPSARRPAPAPPTTTSSPRAPRLSRNPLTAVSQTPPKKIPTMGLVASDVASRYPALYRLFFLYLEPVATLVGAYYAFFRPLEYLELTYGGGGGGGSGGGGGGGDGPSSATRLIVLRQLANMYLVFALNEALVLRATADPRVWRVLLLCLLIADFGHLSSVRDVGLDVYWRFWHWNSMYWGNLGFVYVGATMRMCFLAGVGMGHR